jgi:hypothetical protein
MLSEIITELYAIPILPETYLKISLMIFMLGSTMWAINRLSKCSSWYFGYAMVLLQGAGLFGMITYYVSWLQ